jgi:hypothetical protein
MVERTTALTARDAAAKVSGTDADTVRASREKLPR